MIGIIFSIITLLAVLMATFESHMKRAILSLWVAGIGVGAIYLTVGAEFLAIIQWIVSTLIAISFIFFSVTFGEDPISNTPLKNSALRNWGLLNFLSVGLGLVLACVIGLGCAHLTEIEFNLVGQVGDLATLGRKLTQDHLISLEVLALTLFLVLVGGGVIARSEGGQS